MSDWIFYLYFILLSKYYIHCTSSNNKFHKSMTKLKKSLYLMLECDSITNIETNLFTSYLLVVHPLEVFNPVPGDTLTSNVWHCIMHWVETLYNRCMKCSAIRKTFANLRKTIRLFNLKSMCIFIECIIHSSIWMIICFL